MTEFSASLVQESAAQTDFNPHSRIDALLRGECSADDFLSEIFALRESDSNLVWEMLALIDQRYRRGQLPDDLFHAIKSRLAQHELTERDDGMTAELHPAQRSSGRLTAPAQQFEARAAGFSSDADRGNQIEPTQDVPALARESAALPEATLMAGTLNHSSPFALEVGHVVRGRYALQSVLGRGGMGLVFRALDRQRVDLPEKARHVALKVLDESSARRAESLADLRREFYCTQALAHPNIVKVYDLHHGDDIVFYTMELLEGQLLVNVLECSHPHAVGRPYAWAVIRDVGAALTHAHSRNVVHGDVKPQNIFITESGEVRLLDFGASGTATRQWATSDTLQRNRVPPVTLAYACCELLDGQQTDPRDDLYALACLAYELLAGEHPFQRRRSTEARELGLQPRRPSGLTDRQWRALRLGLSWRREGRSLPVRDWLAMLGLEPAAERLPPLHAPDPASALLSRGNAVRTVALLTALITGLGLWAALPLSKPASDISAEPVASKAPPDLSSRPAPSASNPTLVSAAVASSPQMPKEAAVAPASLPLEAAAVPGHEAPAVDSARRLRPPFELRPEAANQITLSADTYRVPSGEHFAEIDVRRSNESRGNTSFVWWTEASSAGPGSDFIPQNRTRQTFLTGRHWAKLFIRIVPNPSRTHTQEFYVHIGTPGAGYSLGPVTRAAVRIPPLAKLADVAAHASAQR